MIAGLPEKFEPMIMSIEYSGVIISGDSIKRKLLQDVKSEDTAMALYSGHNKKNSTTSKADKPKPEEKEMNSSERKADLEKKNEYQDICSKSVEVAFHGDRRNDL
uniref:Uncharacterized protein n=1 Tax=Megaselia scalaris TaxID=36166 RepID=T1GBT3_MEGSC